MEVIKNERDITYIYLMECEGMLKVGVSKNPLSRASHLQGGNPFEITIRNMWETPYPFEVECNVHWRLGRYRVSGEWFKCDPLLVMNKIGNEVYKAKLKQSMPCQYSTQNASF